MERFLICSNCASDGKESFFKDVGQGFQLNNSMEHCETLMANEEDGPTPSHPLEERLKTLMGTPKGPTAFSLTEFLQDGIKKIPKMKFRDLEPRLPLWPKQVSNPHVWPHRWVNEFNTKVILSSVHTFLEISSRGFEEIHRPKHLFFKVTLSYGIEFRVVSVI